MGGSTGRYASPLRYPGGKSKVAKFFKLLLLQNGMTGVDYVEPYAGGASVGLELLFEDYVGHIQINDLNAGISAFWSCVIDDPDALCARIQKTPVTIRSWLEQREVHRNVVGTDPLDLAFATFFLNRTNRSGIISGGVIGGLDQAGPYKIDARYNKAELIGRIRKISRHRHRIEVTALDAADLLTKIAVTADDTLLYLDPPYFVKGQDLYDNFYEEPDHLAIARSVLALRHSWVVSYDAAPEILAMYGDAQCLRYDLSYSAHQRQQGSEMMFFSDDLLVPNASPSAVPAKTVEQARQPAFF